MKIAIVIGHSLDNQGAYGNAGIGEWQFNDELIQDMFHSGMLPGKHEIYVLYRSADIKGYTNQMHDLHRRIDDLGCTVSIEMHFNSFSDPSANGNEVLYCSEGGKKIADVFDSALDALPNRDRGVKKVTKSDRGGGFCCRGKSYAIILEPFFGANQKDYIHDGRYRDTLMDAIQTGFKNL